MVGGLVFLVVGIAAIAGSWYLIRNRASVQESVVSSDDAFLGGWVRKLSGDGARDVLFPVGVVGVAIGIVALLVGVLGLLGIVAFAR